MHINVLNLSVRKTRANSVRPLFMPSLPIYAYAAIELKSLY